MIKSKQKQNGEVFTPRELANFLANRIMQYISLNKHIDVDDPSCGDGSLLRAITDAFNSANFSDFSIFGTDKDDVYIEKTRRLFNESYATIASDFQVCDFIRERAGSLFSDNKLYNVIIANPPYVRTQTLGNEASQAIAKQYGLSGRIDLYYPFLINMTERLYEGGIIGVITSNRFLTTKSGESIRKYLLSNYDVLEVIDLGDTKLFDAAVLPAIFIGRKNTSGKKNQSAKFLKIYEDNNTTENIINKDSIYDILNSNTPGIYCANGQNYNFTIGAFKAPDIDTEIWQMTTIDQQNWVDRIRNNADFLVGEKFKVRVGVKSCADDVFLDYDVHNSPNKPEEVFFRGLLTQECISAWEINKPLPMVIYPHFDNKGKKDVFDLESYPKAKAFFLTHEERLKKRKYLIESKRKWYEYWVPQNPTLWKNTKLVFPDISVEPRFVVDTSGAIVNGNCYWICATKEEDIDLLYLICGVANSRLMQQYHDLCFNNKLYSGRRRYLSQYVEKYPIPSKDSTYGKQIIALSKLLHSSQQESERATILEKLNIAVNKAFNLPD